MRRVYAIYMYRAVARPHVAKTLVLALSFVGLASLISFPNVLQNMPGDPLSVLSFLTSAFFETEILVQMMSVVFLGFLVWLLPDVLHPRAQTA